MGSIAISLVAVTALCLIAFLCLRRYCTVGYLIWYLGHRFRGPHLVPVRPTKPEDGHRVVVSLTTLPSRIKDILPCLNSILSQSRPPQAIYLHIPKQSKREKTGYDIPDELQQDERITICHHEEDLGPIMKLLPMFSYETAPDTCIVTVDDDTVYPEKLIETLLHFHDRLPQGAIGFRGWQVPASGRYEDRRLFYANTIAQPQAVDVLSGISGVLYVRKQFKDKINTTAALPPEAWYVDDLRISAYLKRENIERYICPFPMREPFSRYFMTSRSNPLWLINRGGNNYQVLLDYYATTSSTASTQTNTLPKGSTLQ